MASVITVAFENWKAQEAASGKAVLLDEFVFANVPNLDPTQPIDRNEKLPPANQIVHRQAVNKAGLASENAVAYSVTLGADVGNFDFNWIGLLNKASGTVAMITHAPTQKKLKTQNGQQGNVLTRSFILEFQGAAEETQIKTSAETWQIDFTARLSGIDEMQRLINVDSYGAAAFFNDGFEVTRSGEQYTVKKGLGYVGGLRGELAQNQILNGLRNTKVYADFSYQGNIVSQWNTVVKITSAATLNNYIDAAGFTHQVFAIASIDASGNVKDLRSKGALSSQEISALEARLKLDLSKKIDKANITHQMGNSTELVVSQQLLATELGKKQPTGNYATNELLNNGLASKFDKTGGRVAGGIISEGNINAEGGLITAIKNNTFVQLKATDAGKPALLSSPDNKQFNTHNLQNKSGTIMHIGDCGFGGLGEQLDQSDWNSIKALIAENKSRIYNSRSSNELNGLAAYAPMFLMQIGNTWANISINHINGRITVSSGYNDFKTITTVYSTANTSTDRNGYLRTSSTTAEMQSIPIGASVLWNTSAPIPANFWHNEGRSFSAAEYPELAKIFTDLKLPDDRGYAIRAADNGRGIDVGRTVGTYQQDAVQKITGDIATSGIENTSATGAFSARTTDEFTNGHYASSARPPNRTYINFDSSRVVRTADETRMKNVAKILITRVK
ncbi:phage tail protein [Providencia rettgeri]